MDASDLRCPVEAPCLPDLLEEDFPPARRQLGAWPAPFLRRLGWRSNLPLAGRTPRSPQPGAFPVRRSWAFPVRRSPGLALGLGSTGGAPALALAPWVDLASRAEKVSHGIGGVRGMKEVLHPPYGGNVWLHTSNLRTLWSASCLEYCRCHFPLFLGTSRYEVTHSSCLGLLHASIAPRRVLGEGKWVPTGSLARRAWGPKRRWSRCLFPAARLAHRRWWAARPVMGLAPSLALA
jgi:hypothetical protein